jgi:hypothetical protein
MANPIPAIIEALGHHMDGWQPGDLQELLAFLDGLPELMEKFHDTLGPVFTDLANDRRITDPVTDAADEVLSSLRAAQDAAPDVSAAFREDNKFWLGGDS